jgi:hypothetical protein
MTVMYSTSIGLFGVFGHTREGFPRVIIETFAFAKATTTVEEDQNRGLLGVLALENCKSLGSAHKCLALA